MILLLVSVAHAELLADCAQTWNARGLLDVVESADINMGKMDTDGFLAARDTLLRRLACVNEPLSGTAVGAVHRVIATGAFLQKEDARIAPALAGLLAADPGYQLPLSLYPEGHPIRVLLSHGGLLARDPNTRPLVSLASGWLEVDGLATEKAPTARAAVIQQVDGQGAVVETRYVWPEADLGTWAGGAPLAAATPVKPVKPVKPPKVKVEREVQPALPTEPVARSGKARVPMLAATAVTVVTTGVLLGAAASSKAAFLDTTSDLTDDELVALRGTTNTLTIGWAAAGVASLGLGVGLAFAW
ncbi:MAG: hypothetical protein Q8P41_24910 [Pseudomonadota bacterium]|nr:hypothetical protein [Pseudomonadota bacterium]